MEFQHFLHHHKLSSKEFEEEDMKQCLGCMDIIDGPAYYCRECDEFGMHKSCAEMPPQIQKHIVHPHPLRFKIGDLFVCDACSRFTFSVISYRCMYCELKLDIKCAMSIFNDETEIGKLEHQGAVVHHFCHPHQLIRCMLSSTTEWEKMIWKKLNLRCGACNLELPGTALLIQVYACLLCQFFIHESCMNEMPTQVQRSSFHPHHVLLPRPFVPSKRKQVRCYACREVVLDVSFYCNECDVNLHVSCAMYRTRSIKHSCHPHDLLQLGKSIIRNIYCKECYHDLNDSCFSCKKCDFNIHLQCIPLPSSFKHKHHLHPLALVNSFVEDDSGDYCYDMCETERNPDL